MPARILVDERTLGAVCRKWKIRRMALFGSVLRPDFTPESDVDVLVEFEPGVRVTLFDLVDAKLDLERLFGRKVDLVSRNALNPHMREDILATSEVIYDAAER
ncbi:MAG: nucleotidyltransferase family protein [Clostridia bacterium]|nr:nucleotidyltransferase family protein [Clostridia bacterium]